MTNLLTRLLRALDGVELEITKLVTDGAERMILAFSNGRSLHIPLNESGRTRQRAAKPPPPGARRCWRRPSLPR